jgi:hypothetical protein
LCIFYLFRFLFGVESSENSENSDTFIGIAREFPEGEGEKKKIKGRSPVPSTGTIIEPHTDKSLNITFPCLPIRSKFFLVGGGG